MGDHKENPEEVYQPPTLTVYGPAETITAGGNSQFADADRGPDDPPSAYST